MSSSKVSTSAPLLAAFAATKPLRTGSLIVSIFGDCIAPRGGVVWLGSLIQVLEPLGISHRVVRTAAYRLVQDGILINEQRGRESYYSLTENGRREFDEATARIYALPEDEWDGEWCLVFTHGLPVEARQEVRRDLAWLGFGQLNSDTLAHPNPDQARLLLHLDRLQVRDRCLVFRGNLEATAPDLDAQVIVDSWNLAGLEQAYGAYIDQFAPILKSVRKQNSLDPEDAFYIRTFMIHEYRKTLLRDPKLPEQLLPRSWKGHTAYQLTRELYRLVVLPSEQFVDTAMRNEVGGLRPPGKSFFTRFGGLITE